MLIATFGPTTAWVGTRITSESGAFRLEGYGPISAGDIMEYDRQGHLVWVNDGARAWVGSRAALSQATKPALGTANPPTGGARGLTSAVGSHLSPRTMMYVKRALLLAIAALVVTNVVILLAVAGVFRDSGNAVTAATQSAGPQNPPSATPTSLPTPQASSWPARLAGTWVNTLGTEPVKAVISESGGQATIVRTVSDGAASSSAFSGNILTITKTATAPTVFARQAPATGPYVGTYVSAASGGTMTMTVSFTGDTLKMVVSNAPAGINITETIAIAEDGLTLAHFDSATGVTTTLTRQ